MSNPMYWWLKKMGTTTKKEQKKWEQFEGNCLSEIFYTYVS